MVDHSTDRRQLTTAAYANGANLAVRQSIYRYQQPQLHFVDWAIVQIEWGGVRTAIDVGCGNGAYLRRLLGRVPRLVGVDLSRGILADAAHAWTADTSASLAVADAQALPLRAGCADVVLAMHMLYHVPDIPAAVRELRRVLRPGGVLLAATNGEPHLRELFDLLVQAVDHVGGATTTLERSFMRFTAENGSEFLNTAFARIEWRPAVSALVVPEAGPIIEYLSSMRNWVEHALPARVTWEGCMAEVANLVGAHVARAGALRIATAAGVFVCG